MHLSTGMWAADIKSSESQQSGWGVRAALQHNHHVEGHRLIVFLVMLSRL
jgi:hypothetical protein